MRKLKKAVIIALLVIVSYVIYVSVDIYQYGNVDETTKADAAIVLGAALWGDQPSPVFEERINHGIWLYQNGYVDTLIFTGGKGENAECSEAGAAKSYAIKNAVPGEDILLEEQSATTQENLRLASQVAKEHNVSTVLLVSDPLHMKRAMLMAQDYGLEAYASPTKTTKYKTPKSKAGFLAREVFYYIGYGAYRLF